MKNRHQGSTLDSLLDETGERGEVEALAAEKIRAMDRGQAPGVPEAMDTTTDLTVVRKTPNLFTWGKVVSIHDLGPYTFLEYTDRDGDTKFHVYVEGKNVGVSTPTLEGAMILAIAQKNLETNEADHMAMAACKVLGVRE